MERVVGAALVERGWRLALAESCTGGLIAKRLTDVPGSSEWFERGFVTYSNAAKTELLGVAPALLAAHGAVSEEVARAMAVGARRAGSGDFVRRFQFPGGRTAVRDRSAQMALELLRRHLLGLPPEPPAA
jgi:nicotinamide mononucleotide (NMN) deamidase PncC